MSGRTAWPFHMLGYKFFLMMKILSLQRSPGEVHHRKWFRPRGCQIRLHPGIPIFMSRAPSKSGSAGNSTVILWRRKRGTFYKASQNCKKIGDSKMYRVKEFPEPFTGIYWSKPPGLWTQYVEHIEHHTWPSWLGEHNAVYFIRHLQTRLT